ITASDVKTLRERTGAPMMACKRALTEAAGDMAKAEVVLLKQGIAGAAKKADRTATEGSIGSYIHAGGKLGVLLDVACESDFVARTDEFQQLVHDVAMHVAATDPKYVSREAIPAADLEAERARLTTQARELNPGKPEAILEKIVEGRMAKFFGHLPRRSAFHQGRQADRARAGGRQDRQVRRKNPGAAFRALQNRRRRPGLSPLWPVATLACC